MGSPCFFAQADSSGLNPGELDSWVYTMIRELQEEFMDRQGKAKINHGKAPAAPVEDTLNEDEINQLRYYQSMIKGALGHLSMAFSEHTVEAIQPPREEPYTSIFDDSDDEGIGTMFG